MNVTSFTNPHDVLKCSKENEMTGPSDFLNRLLFTTASVTSAPGMFSRTFLQHTFIMCFAIINTLKA